MAIEDTALWREVTQIMFSGEKPVHFYWTAEIIANNVVIPAIKLLNKDNQRLYNQNFSDAIVVELALGMGTYNRRVFPYRENLQITLTRTPIHENSNDLPPDYGVVVQTYRAVPVETNSTLVEGNHPIAQSEETADLSNLREYQFQLLDEAGEQVRLVATGGIFHQTTAANVLIGELTRRSRATQSSQAVAIRGVDMVTPDNQNARMHVTVPHGTRLIHLAQYLHEECGGIYNAGMACYLQNGIWYVFPEFNTTRYDTTPKTLTVINVPPQKLPSIERTYRTTPNQTILIATGETQHRDLSERGQLNEGNGARFNSASRLYDGFTTTEGNRTTAARARNANEFKASERDTGLNNVQSGSKGFTDNHFAELSRIAEREGAYVQLVWQHSESGLLYPGQPLRYLYCVDDVVYETFGLLVACHEYTHQVDRGSQTRRHVSHSALTLFVKRQINYDASSGV